MINKVGDSAIVIKKIKGHGFEIGQEVVVTESNSIYYKCEANGKDWLLSAEELKFNS